ncbi:hypothetical protein [Empedobacter sp. UBA7620]|uniref:hypothetical protein n=2 Tax=Weeksellaceae TaxID=2762318 RepID=UPI0025C4C5CA|nr:hypothetical protein [Empedobacter sp. UBA7620]
MTLTDSIGKIITEIKYCYNPENKYGLQEFESFIKIDNDKVIQIPYFPTEEWNESETLKKFELARKVESKLIELILNLKIINYHFKYFENELDEMEKAIIELENGLYITEKNGPFGLTDVDLHSMHTIEFLKLKENIESEFEIKPLIIQ